MLLPSGSKGWYLPVCAGFLTLLSMASCATKECYDNRTTMPLAGFYSSTAPAQSVSVDSLEVYALGVPGDSVLLRPTTNAIRELSLPFNSEANHTDYVFINARTKVSDTVTFRYNCRPWFASEACGVVYRYEMNGITCTGALIDSVTCPEGVITNRPAENLKIYFKVRTTPTTD